METPPEQVHREMQTNAPPTGGILNEEQLSPSMLLRLAAMQLNVAFEELGPNGRPTGRPREDLRHHLNGKRENSEGRSGPAGQGSRLNEEGPTDSYDTIRPQEDRMQISHLWGQAQLLTRLTQINS